MNLSFGDNETRILRDIINIQLQSLSLLEKKEYNQDCLNILKHYEYEEKDLSSLIKYKKSQLEDLYKEPLYLPLFTETDLAIFRHLLYHMEDDYIDIWDGVINLWDIFYQVEEYHNRHLSFEVKQLKRKLHGREENRNIRCRNNKY